MSTAAIYAPPVIESPVEDRVAYLRKVGLLTFLGLGTSMAVGTGSAFVFGMFPALLSGYFPMIIAFGCFALAHYGAQRVVFRSESQAMKLAGFFGGTIFQGIAMGMLLLVAAIISMDITGGNPFLIVGQAFAIVGAAAFGMMAWLMTGPRDLSMVKGALAVSFLPMLVAMAITWAFPIGGIMGIGISMLFVVVSAGGLLYQLDVVLKQLSTKMHVEGAYLVTMSLLVLLWNVIALLSRLQSRD